MNTTQREAWVGALEFAFLFGMGLAVLIRLCP